MLDFARLGGMRNSKGQSLLEVLMVTGLMGVLMVILVGISTTSINRNKQAENRSVATRLAQEGVEWIKSERDRVGWLQLAKKMELGKTWCIANTGMEVEDLADTSSCSVTVEGYPEFVRKVTSAFDEDDLLDPNDPADHYNITVSVLWGNGEEVSLTTELFIKDI